MGKLRTRAARHHQDVAAFFDACAPHYGEQHGDAEKLLRYRLDLLRECAQFRPNDTVLEIGCGSALHLLALGNEFAQGIGTDLSPAMIALAQEQAHQRAGQEKFHFAVAPSENLASVADASIDVVLCVGALEHTLDQGAAIGSVFRVLKPGGRFVCLTLNGGSLWYRWLAHALRFDTRQLATDHYVSRAELLRLFRSAGFANPQSDAWTFVQSGDMPGFLAISLRGLDRLGRWLRWPALRGGLRVFAVK
jgi:2-polyprenyl-6-hydroxyphenyl methylase/3-demethylubiquinone-9 3-methyltransferase